MCSEYIIDKIAATFGRQVLRLPPYRCALNPTSLCGVKSKDMMHITIGDSLSEKSED
jgi:hypothetical protein